MTDVAALRDPINQCISGTVAEKMGYTTEGAIDTLNIYHGLDENSKTSPQTRGLSQFPKEIDVQEDDFVVLKMDVATFATLLPHLYLYTSFATRLTWLK
eukprot:evm.model.NODE_1887_length_28976_cov_48.374657.5